MTWPRCTQIVSAAPGWYSVHADYAADQVTDLTVPVSELVTLLPIPAFAWIERDDDEQEPFRAVVAKDYSYGTVPSGFEIEDEKGDFIGYLYPGGNLETFRGAVLDHYERQAKARARPKDAERAA